MDAALFKQHLQHFSQATGTPFTINPLLSTFREYTETQEGKKFRDGSLSIDQLPVEKYTREFLKELQKKPSDPTPINTNLCPADIKRNYKNWKEVTSTSPSSRYLSLYKTWINNPEEKDDEYEGITSNGLFKLINDIIETATTIAHPLERWSLIHNLYILKKQNLYRSHKLRTIHKQDSKFNMYKCEIVARQLMHNAEQHNFLSEDQHGGCNGREALDIMLGKTITFETLHLQRANSGCTNCDAKACCDRIIPLVLLLAYFKAGLPYQCCFFL
eukprot:15365507-Ditylum_brightwellii.AAC.1